MNAILVQQALERVGSPETLVTLVGKRVRQLTANRPPARPLVEHGPTESAMDIALREILEDKITFELVHLDDHLLIDDDYDDDPRSDEDVAQVA